MKKPVLYLNVVGTLLVDRGGEWVLAPFAHQFAEGVRGKFDIRLLTALEEHQALRVARHLHLDATYIPFRHALGKSSSIRFDERFYWVDDDPNPADLLRLSDQRCSDRLIPVSRREGVTEATLQKLLATYGEHLSDSAPSGA